MHARPQGNPDARDGLTVRMLAIVVEIEARYIDKKAPGEA